MDFKEQYQRFIDHKDENELIDSYDQFFNAIKADIP